MKHRTSMTRSLRFISLVLALCLFAAIPAQAQTQSSIFFSAYGKGLVKTARETFKILFSVTANGSEMDEIGASVIRVYSSPDQEHWTLARTFYKEDWPEMTCENTAHHSGYITYVYATVGMYYRACITFYARDSRGFGENYIYTQVLKM